MNKQRILIFITLNLLICVACGKIDNNEVDSINDGKLEFKENIENILTLVKSFNNENPINEYNLYFIEKDVLYGINQIEDISNYNFDYGNIIKSNNNDIYLSIGNNKYCAIKDFNDSDVLIYNINEQEKCHRVYVDGDKISLSIVATYLSDDSIYDSSVVSNDYISLSAINNIFDKKSYIYKWYKNNEAINNSNVQTYTITSEIEDADYYVEIRTYDDQIIKSEPINVKIDRR